jgi:hypothetical protein
MILETAQLLSTAHRVLDGDQYTDATGKRKIQRWDLLPPMDKLYKATHVNHPSSVWARSSNNNYNWLYCHFIALLNEYAYRYGKHHKCEFLIDLLRSPPRNIAIGYLTQVTPAMPAEYITASSVEAYRSYYKTGKKHLHKWTKREAPEWMTGQTG